MGVRNRKNQKSDKSDKKPSTEKETITVSNDYDWDFGSIAKNKLAKIQEIDPGKHKDRVLSSETLETIIFHGKPD